MFPHDFHAPGLPVRYQRIFKKRPHIAIWRGNDLIRCSCGKPLQDEIGYRQHLNTKASYGDANPKRGK